MQSASRSNTMTDTVDSSSPTEVQVNRPASEIGSKIKESLTSLTTGPSPASSDEPLRTPSSDEKVDPDGAVNDSKDPKPSSEQPASDVKNHPHLWCKVSRRNHIALMDWSIYVCPACGDKLKRPKELDSPNKKHYEQPPSPEDGYYGIRPLSPPPWMLPPPLISNTKKENTEKDPQFEYKIRYLDQSGGVLRTDVWPGPFNLEEARGKSADYSANTILTIITLLQTDVPGINDHRRGPISPYMGPQAHNYGVNDVEVKGDMITIHSRPIIKALRRFITYWPETSVMGNSITVTEPYSIIIHHLDQLVAYQATYKDNEQGNEAPTGCLVEEEVCDKTTYEHIQVLRDFLDGSHKKEIADERLRHLRSPSVVTYPMLWMVLKPGVTVYTEISGRLAACVVSHVRFTPAIFKNAGAYHLQLWYLDFDGRYVGRRKHFTTVFPFDGEREVTSLNVFPAANFDAEDGGELRKMLEARGEKWYKLLTPRQMHYKGDSFGAECRWYEGRVMIDTASYYHNEQNRDYLDYPPPPPPPGSRPSLKELNFKEKYEKPNVGMIEDSEDFALCNCDDCHANPHRRQNPKFKYAEYDDLDPKKIDSLDIVDASGKIDKHRYLLCSRKLIGFVLKTRKWEALDVECCEIPKINNKAIDNLVMPEHRLTMIKALVNRYTNPDDTSGKGSSPWTADFIANKGEGQIFLLHGSPGVGKTYTAECIAEATSRPLLALTCGDIGTNELQMEDQLSKWFRLAEIWGAVMLIDEADVYLEKRQLSDLQRNSLVSVFLRTMEYYRGILFLTTNRVGHFDDAFVSRIHVVIHYPKFSDRDRNDIWKQFFKKLEDERSRDISISRGARKFVLEDKEMLHIQWNGREIRNAFQTAVALAEYRFLKQTDKEPGDKARLEEEDFHNVCEMAGAFRKYLKGVALGADEDQRAINERTRNDVGGEW